MSTLEESYSRASATLDDLKINVIRSLEALGKLKALLDTAKRSELTSPPAWMVQKFETAVNEIDLALAKLQ